MVRSEPQSTGPFEKKTTIVDEPDNSTVDKCDTQTTKPFYMITIITIILTLAIVMAGGNRTVVASKKVCGRVG